MQGKNWDHHDCVDGIDIDTTAEIQEARFKNYIWLMLRMFDTNMQTVCSWTGFNMLIRDGINIFQDTIGYLPTINAPATELTSL